jgi:YVTN family beta-propeller protein
MTSRPATLVAAMTALLLVGAIDASAAMTTPTPAAPACSGAETATATPSAVATRVSTPSTPSESSLLQRVTDVPLPGSASRFDYQSFDETSGRLYVAHMGADQVIVFDTRTQQVIGTVDGVKTPTGVLTVPSSVVSSSLRQGATTSPSLMREACRSSPVLASSVSLMDSTTSPP